MSVTERLDVNKNQLWRRGDATVSEKIPTRLLTGLRSFSALSVQGVSGQESLERIWTKRRTGAN